MRHFKAILLLCVVALASVSLGDEFDRQIASVIILQDKRVQKELDISEKQRTAMNQHADAHRGKLQQYYNGLGKDKPDEARLAEYFAELKRNVLRSMSEAQIKRLREISLQQLSFSALADATVAKRVGINEAQLKQIRQHLNTGLQQASKIEYDAINKATASLQKQKPKTPEEQKKLMEQGQKLAAQASKSVAPQV
ncbi:MAG TPA: hypothetical protein VEX38_09830, partial [Fimbriimonadaceae bacterium]|nr:hypothetical protein [Fimbriimonadaceae bacterium]